MNTLHPDYGGTLLDLGIDSCGPLPIYANTLWYSIPEGPNGPDSARIMRIQATRASLMGMRATFEALFMAYLNIEHEGRPIYDLPRSYDELTALLNSRQSKTAIITRAHQARNAS